MNSQNIIIVVGGLLLLLMIIFAGEWYFADDMLIEQEVRPLVVSNDGLASIAIPSSEGVVLTALSPWQVIEHDALRSTYLGGVDIAGPAEAFATPRAFEMNLNRAVDGVPMLFQEQSGIALPMKEVTYVMSEEGIHQVRAMIDAPGRMYVLQQPVFTQESPALSVSVDAIVETAVGEVFTSAVRGTFPGGIHVYGAAPNQEYGWQIDQSSLSLSVAVHSSSTAVSPNAVEEVVVAQGILAPDFNLPVLTPLECISPGVVPTEVTVEVAFAAEQYVRRVSDWISHSESPSAWEPVAYSTSDYHFRFIHPQSPQCVPTE